MKTLEQILLSQDMGKKGVDKITDAILNDTYERGKDPVTDIIVDAFEDGSKDQDEIVTDIDYAINQLKKAKAVIENN